VDLHTGSSTSCLNTPAETITIQPSSLHFILKKHIHSPTLKLEAAGSTEMFALTYHTTWSDIPKAVIFIFSTVRTSHLTNVMRIVRAILKNVTILCFSFLLMSYFQTLVVVIHKSYENDVNSNTKYKENLLNFSGAGGARKQTCDIPGTVLLGWEVLKHSYWLKCWNLFISQRNFSPPTSVCERE
jgi:hypothetical protein